MITSKTNKTVKLIKSLDNKKYRDKNNLFILEGKKFVDDALKGDFEIKYIVTREKYSGEYKNALVVSDDIFDYISTTKSPQGVLAVISIEYGDKDEIDDSANILYLDNVQDSENVGGLIRTAVCADFDAVVISEGCASPFSAKSMRASAGSILSIKILKDENYDLLRELKDRGFDVTAATLEGSPNSEFNRQGNVLIVGNEGNGVSRECLRYATKEVKIPMSGKCESLNANVSGSILMYKIYGY